MKSTQPDSVVSVPRTRASRRQRAREWPRAPRKDPHTRLIAQVLTLAGPDTSVIATSSRPWASATFLGARHSILIRFRGTAHEEQATVFADALPDAQFSVAGHLVADICVDERIMRSAPHEDGAEAAAETVVRLSALTIEDW